ncbi:MAG: hypothetical protein ACM34I_05675 [bacterium]
MEIRIRNFLKFAVVIILILVVLSLLNWLPDMLQQDTLRRYASIEEVRIRWNQEVIYVPSYFPQEFLWPPANIYAQKRPFAAVFMEFTRAGSDMIGLVLSQTSSDDRVLDSAIRMVTLQERSDYLIKGRKALLEVGVCREGIRCSSLTWHEGKYRIHVIGMVNPFELIKISESMVE